MLKLLATTLALLGLLLTGCAEEEDEDLSAFCAQFQTPVPATPSLTTVSEISDALTFFEQLQPVAPAAVEEDVERVAVGLSRLVEAFAEVEGAQGAEALLAVQEAAGVQLDEVGESAEQVQEFATENCEDIDLVE